MKLKAQPPMRHEDFMAVLALRLLGRQAAAPDTAGPPEWTTEASCLNHSADTFFPESGRGDVVSEARAVCSSCPAVIECLEYGIDDRNGIYGGLTPMERRSVRRQRAAWLAEQEADDAQDGAA